MLKRIGIYLNEMFPLSSIIGSVITAVAVELVYLRMFGEKPVSYFPLIIPGIVLTCISLLIRIMDEFKDYQDDLTNFPNRPLPSGRVEKRDLIGLAVFCIMSVIFFSMTSMPLLIWALITLGFTYLMLKWFFIEDRMRKSLPLAFISHHPIVLFNFVYLIIACREMYADVTFEKIYYILPICLIFTNWEIARKIRAPEQETGYTTYSKIFGPRPAILISLALQIIFNAAVVVIFQQLQSPMWLQGGFIGLQLLLMSPFLRYLINLKINKPLKDFAEMQILLVVGTLLVAALI